MHMRKATPAFGGQRRSLSWPQQPGRPAPSFNSSVETTASKSSTRTSRGCHIHHPHQHHVWGAAVAPGSAKATKALSQLRSYSAGAVASPQNHHFKEGKQKCSFEAGKQKGILHRRNSESTPPQQQLQEENSAQLRGSACGKAAGARALQIMVFLGKAPLDTLVRHKLTLKVIQSLTLKAYICCSLPLSLPQAPNDVKLRKF